MTTLISNAPRSNAGASMPDMPKPALDEARVDALMAEYGLTGEFLNLGGEPSDHRVVAAMGALLVEFDLYVPSTFLGGGFTFVATSGHERRIDYVGLSRSFQPSVVRLFCPEGVTLALEDKEGA